MLQTIILALVFLGTVALLVGTWTYINRRSLAASDEALERLRDVEISPHAAARSILRDASVSALPALDRLLAGKDLTDVLTRRLQRAGLNMTPGAFLLRLAIAAMVGFLLGRLFLPSLAAPILFGAVGAGLTLFWLGMKEEARRRKFQEQLPEAIDMLVSAMKAGYSFQAAMKFIGEEITDPLGPEFGRFYEEQRLGMEVRTALLELQDRVDSLDLRMFVTAILIQRETGGNLSEVLSKISGLMRERQAIKADIATLTAESKLSARILGALPFVVFASVMVVNPGFLTPMLQTAAGPWILLGATMSVAFGYWMMMKIADIEV